MTTTGLASAELSVSESQVSSMLTGGGGQQTMLMTVTDYDYGNINPCPVKLQKDMELLEEFLSPRKLQVMTGVENLDTVEYLEMRVNTDQVSLGNFGMYVPNLSQMKLSGSYIPTIRDLGTSLWNLQVLWMPQCCLGCLDGLVTMSAIRELYLAYNEIEDISSCGMLEQLEILDLEGNRVADSSDLHYLTMCRRLSRLTLEGNPLCDPHKYDGLASGYRHTVLELVPQLEFLDDLPRDYDDDDDDRAGDSSSTVCAGDGLDTTAREMRSSGAASVGTLDTHWDFINSMLLEVGLLAESARSQQDESGGKSCSSTPVDSGRPVSSGLVRPGSGARLVPQSAAAGRRPLTGRAPQDSDNAGSATAADNDPLGGTALGQHRLDDSSLTAGPLVCGSVTKSLRRRPDEQVRCRTAGRTAEGGWARQGPHQDKQHQQQQRDQHGSVTARTPRNLDLEESCEAVLKDLGQWRRDYEISRAQIALQKAPQVLTIDCGDGGDIQHIDLQPSTVKEKCARTGPSTGGRRNIPGSNRQAQPDVSSSSGPNQSTPATEAGTKKLNPIRGGPGRGAAPKQMHKTSAGLPASQQSPWTPPASLARSSPLLSSLEEDGVVQHCFVTEKPPPVQSMSRMRRQLLESCALSSIAPSKPLLKR